MKEELTLEHIVKHLPYKLWFEILNYKTDYVYLSGSKRMTSIPFKK